MNERIKLLRKTLRLTQTEFAERIGSVQNTITGYESGRRTPSNQVIALICKEFNVNEEWLRTGVGEMFFEGPEDEIDSMVRGCGLSSEDAVLIKKIVKLSPKVRDAAIEFLAAIADAFAKPDNALVNGIVDIDVDAAVEDYRRQLEEQKKAAAGSSASDGGKGGNKSEEVM